MIVFLGPKSSIEKNLSKKNGFQDDKTFCPRFRRFIECEKPHKTKYKGPQTFLIMTMENIGAFSRT